MNRKHDIDAETKRALLAALADPEDVRTPAVLEAELGLGPGAVAELLKGDLVFRSRLEEAVAANRHLARLAVIKSMVAKAREGSFQHQKYLLESLDRASGDAGREKMTVEFVIKDAVR